jgi:hypothetical protein
MFCLNLNQTHRKANLKLSSRIKTRVDNKIDPATKKSSLKVDNIDLIQQKKWSIKYKQRFESTKGETGAARADQNARR